MPLNREIIKDESMPRDAKMTPDRMLPLFEGKENAEESAQRLADAYNTISELTDHLVVHAAVGDRACSFYQGSPYFAKDTCELTLERLAEANIL